MIVSLGWQVEALADSLLVAERISRTVEFLRLSSLTGGRTGARATETGRRAAAARRAGALSTAGGTGSAHGCDDGSCADVRIAIKLTVVFPHMPCGWT